MAAFQVNLDSRFSLGFLSPPVLEQNFYGNMWRIWHRIFHGPDALPVIQPTVSKPHNQWLGSILSSSSNRLLWCYLHVAHTKSKPTSIGELRLRVRISLCTNMAWYNRAHNDSDNLLSYLSWNHRSQMPLFYNSGIQGLFTSAVQYFRGPCGTELM